MLKQFCFILLIAISTSVHAKRADDGSQIQPDNYYPRVKMETSMGDMIIELDRRKAPITTNNFLRYVDKRSYEGTIIHRIVPDYVIQGGGYTPEFEGKPSFPAIFNESGSGLKNQLYTIAMARQNEPHSATRQFFFNMADNDNLDPGKYWGYSVFGSVVEGYETLDKINQVETEYNAMLNLPTVPVEPIIINKVTVLPQQF